MDDKTPPPRENFCKTYTTRSWYDRATGFSNTVYQPIEVLIKVGGLGNLTLLPKPAQGILEDELKKSYKAFTNLNNVGLTVDVVVTSTR